jgi:hypothetical protein
MVAKIVETPGTIVRRVRKLFRTRISLFVKLLGDEIGGHYSYERSFFLSQSESSDFGIIGNDEYNIKEGRFLKKHLSFKRMKISFKYSDHERDCQVKIYLYDQMYDVIVKKLATECFEDKFKVQIIGVY